MKDRSLKSIGGLLIGLLLVSGSALAQKWTLSVGGTYLDGFKVGGASYTRDSAMSYVSIRDNGSISSSLKKNGGVQFGLMYSFSKNWGAVLQVGYTPAEPINLKTNYTFSWVFSTTDKPGSYSVTQQQKNGGDLTLTPVNLDLVLTLPLGRTTLFNMATGVSVLFTKARLYSGMGYGVSRSAVVEDLKWKFTGSATYNTTTKSAAWVDYYNIQLKAEEQKTSVGFNFYVDLEQKFSKTLGIFLGVYYCSVSKVDATWKLVGQSTYDGVLGNLDSSTAGGVGFLPPIKSSVTFSHYSPVVGLKLHF